MHTNSETLLIYQIIRYKILLYRMNINRQKLKLMLCNSKKCIIFTMYCRMYGPGFYTIRKSRLQGTRYSDYLESFLIRKNWGFMLNAPLHVKRPSY